MSKLDKVGPLGLPELPKTPTAEEIAEEVRKIFEEGLRGVEYTLTIEPAYLPPPKKTLPS